MLIGYARVSTLDQDLALQLDALKQAGCEKLFTEKASGAQRDRPRVAAALEYMRSGDTLVIWKLDRLAHSLKQLIETVEGSGEKGMGLRSLTESPLCQAKLRPPRVGNGRNRSSAVHLSHERQPGAGVTAGMGI